MRAPLRSLLVGLCLWAGSGCGWYYLEPDPAELPQGVAAPTFTLARAGGGLVGLEQLRAEGHVVLVFYRGKW